MSTCTKPSYTYDFSAQAVPGKVNSQVTSQRDDMTGTREPRFWIKLRCGLNCTSNLSARLAYRSLFRLYIIIIIVRQEQ
jgi:hypothetical protein